jgi:hypothetical protein
LSGIRTHDPRVGAGEDGSCLRPRSHCDRRELEDMWAGTIVDYFKVTFRNLSGVSEENQETLNTIVGVSAEIRTRRLPNIGPKPCFLSQLAKSTNV